MKLAIVGAAMFLGSAAVVPWLEGKSSCDLQIHFNAAGLQISCPSQHCSMCGKPPIAAIEGFCTKVHGKVAGVATRRCECAGPDRSSGDTCFAVVAFDPVDGPTVYCECNTSDDCDCFPGFVPPPGVSCMRIAAFPITPTQVCQCVGSHESFGSGG